MSFKLEDHLIATVRYDRVSESFILTVTFELSQSQEYFPASVRGTVNDNLYDLQQACIRSIKDHLKIIAEGLN